MGKRRRTVDPYRVEKVLQCMSKKNLILRPVEKNERCGASFIVSRVNFPTEGP